MGDKGSKKDERGYYCSLQLYKRLNETGADQHPLVPARMRYDIGTASEAVQALLG